MKFYFRSLKNNTLAQNAFLVCALIAFVGAILRFDFYTVIAWFCCFVLFIMFSGERDQNKWLRDRLDEERQKNLELLNRPKDEF